MSVLAIWVDGASNVHDKKLPGGWASVYVYNRMLMQVQYDGECPTTNQRMELMGALMGLKNLNLYDTLKNLEYNEINMYSDSAYLINCMNERWYVKWRFNNWKTGDFHDTVKGGQAVKNRDLWEELLSLVEELKSKHIYVRWVKVKGHKGLVFNEVADKLAVKGKKSVV